MKLLWWMNQLGFLKQSKMENVAAETSHQLTITQQQEAFYKA